MPLPRRSCATALSAAVLAPVALFCSAAAPAHASTTPPSSGNANAVPAPAGCTGPASNTWIDVVVEGIRSSKGLVAITLYADNSKKFLVKHGSLYVGRVDAREGSTRGCIHVPKPGVYAIAIYHDENGNQGFDRSGFGLPVEAYGFANNPSTLAGLPTFKSVRISIPRSGLVTRVRLTYP